MNSKHAMWLTIIVAVAMMPCAALASTVKGLNCPGGVHDRASTGGTGSLRIDRRITLEAWVYPTAWRPYLSAEKHSLKIINKGLLSALHADWGMLLSENGKLTYGSKYGGLMTANPVVPLNQWTHVAVSVNEDAGTCRLFVNGAEITALVEAGTHYPYGSIQPSDYPVGIGGFDQCGWGYNNDNFIGQLADVRVWSVERTPAQIATSRNATLTGNEPGLAGYWFGGDNGLTDASGNGNDLTLVGAATIFDASIAGLSQGGISPRFIAPTNGAVYAAPATIPVNVTAAFTGVVNQIQVLEGGTNLLFSAAASNLTESWSGVQGGSYTLIARATNTASGQTGEASVNICVRGPYGGTAAAVPGSIETENYDYGRNGLGFSDTTAGNAGLVYRNDDVDIAADGSAGNGHVVGWVSATEWLEYTVNVASSGTYTIEFRVACNGAGGTFHMEVDGTDVTGTMSVPDTGGWSTFQTVSVSDVTLSAGARVLGLYTDSANAAGWVGNFDQIDVILDELSQRTPYGGVAHALPGVVECENYDEDDIGIFTYSDTTVSNAGGVYRADDVDLAADGNASNGYVVGWARSGEWLEYMVDVASNGNYTIQVRLACGLGGGTYHVEVGGVDKTGPLTVPSTGSWGTYQVIEVENVALTAGDQLLRLEMDGGNASGWVANFDQISVIPYDPTGGQGGYGGSHAVPGAIECEDFDIGGDAIAYSDTTAGNTGGVYRPGEDVDVAAVGGASNGYVVGWTKAGEWLEYTIDVSAGGMYRIEVEVACNLAGGTFHFEVDGSPVGSTVTMPNTGSWGTYETVEIGGISLSTGTRVLKLYMDGVNAVGWVGNFDQIRILQEIPQTPYTPTSLPGTIECENYDTDGSGVAYLDTTIGNVGAVYRSDNVDIAADAGAGNGYLVGWTRAGEWLEYTVTAGSGTYDMAVRVACNGLGGTFHLEVNGVPVGTTKTVPNTGGWSTYQDVSIPGISISSGSPVIRLEMDSGNANGWVGNFDRIVITPSGPAVLPQNDKSIQVATGPVVDKVLTGDDVEGEESSGWLAVDGDEETAWTGAADAGGWWILLAYSEEVTVDAVELLLTDGSLTDVQMLGSLDADEWYDVGEVLDADLPGVFNYLWLIFADDESGAVPEVKEVLVY